jgi:hypothetical protein
MGEKIVVYFLIPFYFATLHKIVHQVYGSIIQAEHKTDFSNSI